MKTSSESEQAKYFELKTMIYLNSLFILILNETCLEQGLFLSLLALYSVGLAQSRGKDS